MVTRDELLKQLQDKALRVFPLEKYVEVNGKDYYQFFRYYWQDGNILRSDVCCIHVLVDEQGNEEAYWKDRVPSILMPTPTTTFRETVEKEISKIQTDRPEIEKAVIMECNEEKKYAILRVFIYDGNTDECREAKILVWEKEDKLNYKMLE